MVRQVRWSIESVDMDCMQVYTQSWIPRSTLTSTSRLSFIGRRRQPRDKGDMKALSTRPFPMLCFSRDSTGNKLLLKANQLTGTFYFEKNLYRINQS